MNMDKINFAFTINSFDNGLAKTGNECFNYGINYGCDEDCPKFQRGECELEEDVKKMLKDKE